jgi:integrase
MANSSVKTAKAKPTKPRPDFPLFPHASGRWAKKIRQKLHYFGSWKSDPKGTAANALWLDQKDDLLAGRTPVTPGAGVTNRDLCNRFLTAKTNRLETGELSPRTYSDYKHTCDILIEEFGKTRRIDDLRSTDFEKLRASLAKTRGPVALGNEIGRIRVVFKYAVAAKLIEKPVDFGPEFQRPSKRVLRAERQRKGQRMFEARQIRRMLKAASPTLRAMILLGANAGFGNHDVGSLPLSAVDRKSGWVDFPRPKTAIPRRVPLWPETIEAIQESLAIRPEPVDPAHANLVFLTRWGQPWANDTAESPLVGEIRKLLKKLGMYRRGLGFYALRHGFQTIGGDSGDAVAVSAIMGHVDGSMAGQYRERISDARLQAVTSGIRRWLFRRGDSAPAWQPVKYKKGRAA